MPLDKEQQFLRENFRVHAKLASIALAIELTRPEHQFKPREDLIYCCLMAFVENSFKAGKIIVKSNPEWDALEKNINV